MPFKPWTLAMLTVLEDGAWHAREDLILVGAAQVPPGVAFRDAEKDRNREHKRPNGPGPRVKGDDQTSVSTGARNVARDCLNNLLTSRHGNPPHLERATVDGVDSLRLARARMERAS